MSALVHHPSVASAAEINRLYAEAARLSEQSSTALHAALAAAWQAGHLLLAEKKRVRRLMGPGAWVLWLEQNFHGTPRTAQRYMLLARSVTDVTFLAGMGLRQAYVRLGIATEKKTPAAISPVRPLPRHVSLANKLLGVLTVSGRRAAMRPQKQADYQRDLRVLYERLRMLFDG